MRYGYSIQVGDRYGCYYEKNKMTFEELKAEVIECKKRFANREYFISCCNADEVDLDFDGFTEEEREEIEELTYKA
jgi:hypothetical protein